MILLESTRIRTVVSDHEMEHNQNVDKEVSLENVFEIVAPLILTNV